MSCPFLKSLPSTFVRNYTPHLVKQYAQHCPGMKQRGISTIGSVLAAPNRSDPKVQASFPFLKEIDHEIFKHESIEGKSQLLNIFLKNSNRIVAKTKKVPVLGTSEKVAPHN